LHTLLPAQTQKTIGDLLDAANINWVWYSDGYKAAAAAQLTGNFAGVDSLFQYHHHPFAYYAVNAYNGAKDAAGNVIGNATTDAHRVAHLKDRADFIAAIDDGSLPPVTFYKPIGEN